MRKPHYYSIGFASIAALMLVGILYYYSKQVSYVAHNFKRNFEPTQIVPLRAHDIRYNSYYIAGVSNGSIYFGNHMAPMHLLRADTTLADTTFISVELDQTPGTAFTRSVQVKVSDSLFYVLDGGLPGIFRGRLGEWTASRFMYDSMYFIRALPLTSSAFAFLAMGKAGHNVLGRLTANAPHVKVFESYLEKQIDGIFCTDGDLLYSNDSDYLVFLYRYRNDYIIMNHSMNDIKMGKTIDPVDRVRIKPHRFTSDSSLTLANPGGVVNRKGVVSGRRLFVHSNIRATNDDYHRFVNAAVIDIYDLTMRKYLKSFYLPDHKGNRVKDFLVIKQLIAALYEHDIVIYRFREGLEEN